MKLTSIVGLFLLAACACSEASDFRDAPSLSANNLEGALDLGDLYVFRSPVDEDNTVLALTLSQFANVLSPITFDSKVTYEFHIDQDRNLIPDVSIQVRFSPPNSAFVQNARATLVRKAAGSETLISDASTGKQATLRTGGLFQAGLFDDPLFFDMQGYLAKLGNDSLPFPRAQGAVNYFGPNANCLAIVIEIPTRLISKDDRPVVGVWCAVRKGAKQIDRVGQPFASLFAIPLRAERVRDGKLRELFNSTPAVLQSRRFRAASVDFLQDFWNMNRSRAGAFVDDVFLPDILYFDTSLRYRTTAAYPNGRGLRDDVADTILKLITGDAETSDGVGDDNGDRITDGKMETEAKFPYLGTANKTPSGPPVE